MRRYLRRAVVRRVVDHDAAIARGIHVDCVKPRARPPDDPDPGAERLDMCTGDGIGGDDDGVGVHGGPSDVCGRHQTRQLHFGAVTQMR